MNKQSKFIVWTAMFLLFLCACDPNPYVGKRPMDYEGSIWVCENADMIYSGINSGANIISINGDNIAYDFVFGWGSPGVIAYEWDENDHEDYSDELFHGKCEFGEWQFKIEVKRIDDERLANIPDELVFNRIK